MEMEEAKALIEKEKTERATRCLDRIQSILKEENCDLETVMIITQKGNIPKISIVPLEK